MFCLKAGPSTIPTNMLSMVQVLSSDDHFEQPHFPGLVTAVLSSAVSQNSSVCPGSKYISLPFAALPLDRPLLRVANALARPAAEGEARSSSGGSGSGAAKRLTDVHVGLPPSKVTGGTVHLVDGSYEYFHYLQVGRSVKPCSEPNHA